MAIKIRKLKDIAKQYEQSDYTFKDLHLDYEQSGVYSPELGKKIDGNDIRVDYDERAIRNSLQNLFNTKPGQRFLFPKYGLDLYQYLFEPITTFNAQAIGEKIVRAIDIYEPRVKVESCNVVSLPEQNTYEIAIALSLPNLNTLIPVDVTLDIKTQSFVFLETSRTI